MRSFLKAAVCVTAGTLLLSAVPAGASESERAPAQSFQGGVRGAVKDSQGIIPGATVTLTNEATNLSRETSTNNAGEFSFPAVDPGTYTIRASVQGFKTFERKGVRIGTQQFLTLDITLEIGVIQETMTVTAATPLIETSNASTGEVLDTKTLETLPSVGRNVFLMSVTVPTVQSSGDTHWNRMQDQTGASTISLGGGGVRANNYLLDGFPVTDLANRSSTNPSAEALEDVRVQVHTYDAEMGRTGGGVLNTTGRSGSNVFRGSGFAQFRPNALIGDNFFLRIQDIENAPQYWRSFGGGVGGPLIRSKTFFWVASEAYRDGLTQNQQQHLPTRAMRNGDFSGLRDSQGRLIVIYDPLTTDASGNRQAFSNNIIPQHRISTTGRNLLNALPLPDSDVDTGASNRAAQDVVKDAAQQVSVKVDHRFNDAVSLSGMYLFQNSREPNTNFFPDAPYAAPSYQLNRAVNVAVLNNTYVINNSTVATFRAGMNTFADDNSLPFPFDTHTLGWNSAFADAIPVQKYPSLTLTGYNGTGFTGQQDRTYYSYGVNGTVTRLAGAHSFKVGADYRILGVDAVVFGQSAGSYTFNGQFTGSNATSPSATSRNAIADLLLGYPSSGTLVLNSPVDNYIKYYSVFMQDDWRVGNRLTVNFGIRLEHETGMRERDNQLVVGFDRDAISPLNTTIAGSLDPRTGQSRQVRGGLRYAGVDGAPTETGDQPAIKFSPRGGLSYLLNQKTVVRGGYGLFWSPWVYGVISPVGYSQTTTLQQNTLVPITSIDNPFPNGLTPPSGNARGLLTGVSSSISFVDETRDAPRVHQYSVDIQRELPGNMSVTVGYIGATGRHLSFGGTSNTNVNINQLDPMYQALPSTALTQLVANPFFGNPQAGGFATQATLQRGQLLRPFPQFLDVNMQESTLARSQYHAGVIQLRKRMSNGWGGSFSYTLSRLEDNQFGQSNYYTAAPGILNHYTAIPGSPYFDLDAEYGRSLIDSPHKFAFSPIVELPFGSGRRWLSDGGWSDAVFGGWSVSAVISIQSGFPIGVSQTPNNSGLFGSNQRPNIVPGQDFRLPGSITDRLESDPSDNRYLNQAAFSLAPANTFGNAPRILPGVYSPWRNSTDLAINKEFRTGGSSRATVRVEIINLFDNPWYAELASTAFGAATFGQVTTQGNYSRLAQMTFRLSF
jgi:trimeric autotransporter adhesin